MGLNLNVCPGVFYKFFVPVTSGKRNLGAFTNIRSARTEELMKINLWSILKKKQF